jgi:hypothetical protein
MAEWKKKLRFWRNDARLARGTGEKGSGEGPLARPKPNLADRVAETPAAAQTEESAFGVKLLVPGEAPTIE